MKSINICHYISGKSRQKILILDDKLTNWKVEGILLDGYHLNEIHLRNEENLLKINAKSFFYLENEYKWNENKLFLFDNIKLETKKNRLIITLADNNDKFTTIIERFMNKYATFYLNIEFQMLGVVNEIIGIDKDRYDGLFSEVENNEKVKWKIEKRKVKIGKELLLGKKNKNSSSYCILLPIKQLIESDKLQSYVSY